MHSFAWRTTSCLLPCLPLAVCISYISIATKAAERREGLILANSSRGMLSSTAGKETGACGTQEAGSENRKWSGYVALFFST